MLQIMEDGVLTDSQGRRVDFKNCVIVMTSNVGAKNITEKRKQLGFSAEKADGEETVSVEKIREAVMGDLRRTFKPEFLNRIDEIIVFHQLSRENIKEIAKNMLAVVKERIAGMGIDLTVEDGAVELLAKRGFDPVYGARPLRRAIQSAIEDGVAEKILDGAIKEGDRVEALDEDGKISLKKAE